MQSLDLYHPWNTSEPLWSLIEPTKNRNEITAPVAFFAATFLPNLHRFFIDGGITIAQPERKSSTIYFDTLKENWVSPNLNGQIITRRKQHTAVSDDQGRIWLWGGLSDISTNITAVVYYNTWTVIDSQTWTVSYPIMANNPPPRIDHTATMVANKYILITGGVVYSHDVTDPVGQLTLNPVSMSSLLLFDIPNNKWINITAGGNIPAPRRGHSAVLSLDGKSVVIFGGGMPEDDHQPLNDVFILELESMRWTAPSIKGVPPKPRRYHTAYMVDDFMLVAFGLGGDGEGFDDVNILSTSSWSWITQYTPNLAWLAGNQTLSTGIGIIKNDTGNTYDPNSSTNDLADGSKHDASSETRIKAGVIAGVVSGGVVILGGGIFLILSLLILRKRHEVKAKKSNNSVNTVDLASINRLQDNISVVSDILMMESSLQVAQCLKPDNRSSYATQIDDGKYYKPNA